MRKRAGLTNKSILQNLTQDQMRQRIIKERRVELAFEGHRWFDMIRIDNGQYALDFFTLYRKSKCCPQTLTVSNSTKDIDTNPNLKQNPGY